MLTSNIGYVERQIWAAREKEFGILAWKIVTSTSHIEQEDMQEYCKKTVFGMKKTWHDHWMDVQWVE
jgi:hypothetical protein